MVYTIAITGGPCGGKSTGLSVVEQELTNRGYKVFVLNELSTTLINSGAAPWSIDLIDFQRMIISQSISRYGAYLPVAKKYSEEHNCDVVLLCDRGIIDCMSYVGYDIFYDLVVNDFNSSIGFLRDFYDGVFHLVTAAKGAEKFYTLENNSARTESIEEAVIADDKLIKCWTGHPHFRIIENKVDQTFEDKIYHLLDEIFSLLGVPVPLEIEKKFLIKKPDLDELINNHSAVKVNIIQTYLNSDNGYEKRVRQRGVESDGTYTYYYTEKRNISGISREEIEKKISEKEYLALLMQADTKMHQIRKDRYCFLSDGKYFELDVYPWMKDNAILEVELTSENEEFIIPAFIDVIKDVTNDDNYKNYNLSITLNV